MSELEPRGVVASITHLASGLIASLPPAFLILVLVNTLLLGTVLWFVDRQLEQRMAIATRLIDRCLGGP